MPITMGGKQFTADSLQETAGNYAAMIRDHVFDAMQFKTQLETWPDADLVALGLSQEEINAIKGFYVGDLPAIYNLVTSSVWIKQLLGLGV